MYSRWFSIAVIVLWLGSMGWLLTEKVLPPLLVGGSLDRRAVFEAQLRRPSVGWRMDFNGRQIGWAQSRAVRLPGDLTEIRSRVHFDRFPLEEVTPPWLRAFLKLLEQPVDRLEMDARSTLIIDPLGRLSQFDSSVRLNPLENLISLRGTVEDGKLDLSVRARDFSYSTEAYLPENALLADALSPQTELPGLRVGQRWRVPAYSLFRPPNSPLEILLATVEGIDRIGYNGRIEDTYLVVYRPDPGTELGNDRTVRGRRGVRQDGTVLKQQVMLFGSVMTFVRLSQEETLSLENRAGGA